MCLGDFKSSLSLLVVTTALMSGAAFFLRDLNPGREALFVDGALGNRHSASFANSQPQAETGSTKSEIEAGKRVGALRIGDTAAQAFEVFPRKLNVDCAYDYADAGCGTEYLWVDLQNPRKGNVTVRIKDSRVFQIESATTRYRLHNGITILTNPEAVKKNYPGLRAFYLVGTFSKATGGRPLIFWVDQAGGIAFAFAYHPRTRHRYLYKIIVFGPNSMFCPDGAPTSTPEWLELKPYSVELPSN